MINDDLERWKQVLTWLDECDMRMITILEEEAVPRIQYRLDLIREHLLAIGLAYQGRIKSRETLKAQLQDSLSQATDGGKADGTV